MAVSPVMAVLLRGLRQMCSFRGWQACRALGILQDEATEADSVSDLPMFGNHFPV
jgi:hypothetical protein